MKVFKISVPLNDEWHRLPVLKGLDGLLHVAEQFPEADIAGGTLQLWFFSNDDPEDDTDTKQVEVRVFGTGHPLPEDLHHVGSVVTYRGRLVWHLFAREV